MVSETTHGDAFLVVLLVLSVPFYAAGQLDTDLSAGRGLPLPASALMFVCPAVAALALTLRAAAVVLVPGAMAVFLPDATRTGRELPGEVSLAVLAGLAALFLVAGGGRRSAGPATCSTGWSAAGACWEPAWCWHRLGAWHVVPYAQAGYGADWIVGPVRRRRPPADPARVGLPAVGAGPFHRGRRPRLDERLGGGATGLRIPLRPDSDRRRPRRNVTLVAWWPDARTLSAVPDRPPGASGGGRQ